ncbi:MAG: polysaccharide pyruvyl transferase family protein [Promethearchaeota archaeon]|jgi:polysaccharide pyruvyl transferase WcaK-like protein
MKIYIPEPIPSGNKGEEAILQGIYEGLKENKKEKNISVFSYDHEFDKKNYGNKFKVVCGTSFRPSPNQNKYQRIFETIEILIKHISFLCFYFFLKENCFFIFKAENWKEYISADLLLVGHDGMLSDLNLIFALFSKALGKKTAIFGCGFKKFRYKISEKLARFIIPKMGLVTLREKRSYNYLKSIGVQTEDMYLRPDPAFLMKPAESKDIDNFFDQERLTQVEGPLIGFVAILGSIHFSEYHQYIKDINQKYEKHFEFFAKIVEKVLEFTTGTAVFIPHSVQNSGKRDDRRCARDVKSKMRKYQEKTILIENEYSAEVLKGVIERLDFLISQRLHSIIGAASVGTPFIMLTVKGDERAHDIIENTIKSKEMIFDLNTPKIEEFTQIFEKLWYSKKNINNFLLNRAQLIHDECRDASRLLAQLLP